MESFNYQAIAELQASNWWYRGRRRILERVLLAAGPFLRGVDLGCGAGTSLAVLSRHCSSVVGVDSSEQVLRHCRENGRAHVILGDIYSLGFSSNSVDLITCLDVIEHLQNDEAAVDEMWRILRPGGIIICTTPAHQFLWTQHDVDAHHFRRYNRSRLEEIFGQFTIEHLRYWNFIGFPMLVAYLVAGKMPRLTLTGNNLNRMPNALNKPLDLITQMESFVSRVIPPPTGSSFFLIASKPAAQ